MTEIVETALDVPLDDPSVWQAGPVAALVDLPRQEGHPDVLQSAMGAPSGPEAVGDIPELRLEDWLQECLDRALNNAVLDRGNGQGTELPWFTRFGDELAPRRAGSICAGAQFGLKLVEESPFPNLGADAPHGHPVDPADRRPRFEATRRQL